MNNKTTGYIIVENGKPIPDTFRKLRKHAISEYIEAYHGWDYLWTTLKENGVKVCKVEADFKILD